MAAAPQDEPTWFVLRLSVPPALQDLPWECLYDEAHPTGFVLADPHYSLVRGVSTIRVTRRAAKPQLPVSMLVVVPEGFCRGEPPVVHSDNEYRLPLQSFRLVDRRQHNFPAGKVRLFCFRIGHPLKGKVTQE